MAQADGPAIEAVGLARRHGRLTAVDALNLTVPRGVRLGIVGPNGAGKTTLMRMLSGTLRPTAGRLHVLGHDMLARPREAKARIGVVPQGMTLDTELRVAENIAVFARYHALAPVAREDAVHRGLNEMGLERYARSAVSDLSGGMQRRLLIARALLHDPDLVLLDEPTSGLDPESRDVVWQRLLESNGRGATLIVTSHHLDEIEALCDEILLLDAGRPVLAIRTAELHARLDDAAVEAGPPADSADPSASIGRRTGTPPSIEDGVRRIWRARRAGEHSYLLHPDPSVQTRARRDPDASTATVDIPGRAGSGRSGAPRTPSTVNAARLWIRNYTLFKRAYRTTIVPNFFEPLFLLLALGLGLGPLVRMDEGQDFLDFIAPGLLAVCVVNGAIFEVTYNIFVRLRFARSYDAVVTTPVEPQDIGLGELLWALTRCLLYSTVFVVVLALLGLLHGPWIWTAPLLLLPLGLVFACVGMLYTSRVQQINSYSYFYALVLTPLMLVSGVYFPVPTDGPGAIGEWFNPLHHGVSVAHALAGDGGPGAALGDLAWLVIVGAALAPPAVLSLRRHLAG